MLLLKRIFQFLPCSRVKSIYNFRNKANKHPRICLADLNSDNHYKWQDSFAFKKGHLGKSSHNHTTKERWNRHSCHLSQKHTPLTLLTHQLTEPFPTPGPSATLSPSLRNSCPSPHVAKSLPIPVFRCNIISSERPSLPPKLCSSSYCLSLPPIFCFSLHSTHCNL